jgi:hypothetical protein
MKFYFIPNGSWFCPIRHGNRQRGTYHSSMSTKSCF